VGSDIDGEAAGDQSSWSVSLSADGSVVAIGANNNDGNGLDSGHVRVYQVVNQVTVAENQTAVTTATAIDADGDSLTYSLGGVDAARFNISNNGEISFITAPDYENPGDVGTDNTYNITVTASDGTLSSTAQNLAIAVTDVNEVLPPGNVVDLLVAPMYRFRNDNVPGAYLFVGEQEAQSIAQNPLYSNFINEGFVFAVATSQSDPLLRPFYRFANTTPGREGSYLFVGEQEAHSIRQNHPNFRLDGLAFYALDAGFGNGSTDFSRFQNLDNPGTYLLAGPTESAAIVNYPNFNFEGLAFAADG
jgi:hypothetical protein